MSQRDVLEFLENERQFNDKWFTPQEIKKKFKELGKQGINGIPSDCLKLAGINWIEWKGVGIIDHKKVYRGEKKNI